MVYGISDEDGFSLESRCNNHPLTNPLAWEIEVPLEMPRMSGCASIAVTGGDKVHIAAIGGSQSRGQG